MADDKTNQGTNGHPPSSGQQSQPDTLTTRQGPSGY